MATVHLVAPRIFFVLTLLVLFGLPARFFAAEADTKQEVIAGNYVVVSGHPDATRAGTEVLRRGGNAIDAAVAVSLCLGVAEPYGSGLGGKLALLYYNAASKKASFVEALEAAPRGLSVPTITATPKEQREFGIVSVCTPGLPAGLFAAHKTWGSQRWPDLVAPAIKLARDGFTVSQLTADIFAASNSHLKADAEASRIFLPGGKVPALGATLKNPDIAKILEEYSARGSDGFYKGTASRLLSEAAKRAGGTLSQSDFDSYKVEMREPIAIDYRGYKVIGAPPPFIGSPIVLMCLKALEARNWTGVTARSADEIDAVCRTLQLVYPRVANVVGDQPGSAEKLQALFAADKIREISEAASRHDKLAPVTSELDAGSEDAKVACTTHFVIIDSAGNIVSATQSLGSRFGAGIVVPGTGMPLNNGMKNFGYNSKTSPNYVAPGKKPRSTISPTIVLAGARPFLTLGAPAGQRIPTGVLQVALDVLDFNTPLPEAVQRPRFHLRRPVSSAEPNNVIDIEEGAPAELDAQLTERGWKIERKEKAAFYFGGVNAAMFLQTGKIIGVADGRRTNDAGGE
jgi:gamma-glutamyltranspeptidase/glutathione hydrolase